MGTEEVHHQGDFMNCSVLFASIVVRYHISKQNLCLPFPYRRWKWTVSEWQPLDLDDVNKEQITIQVSMHVRCIETILVNEDWHLGNLRDYLALQFSLEAYFKFCIDNFIVRACREKLMFCKNYGAPQIICVNNEM